MFDRFDDDARAAVVYAQEEARLSNHHDIGAEHLLIGVLRVTDELAQSVLHASLERVRDHVLGIRPPSHQLSSGHIPFTANAKRSMELALRTSLELGQDHVTTAHLLAGILKVDDRVVTGALTGLNLDPAGAYLRARTWAIATPGEPRPSPRREVGPAAVHGHHETDQPSHEQIFASGVSTSGATWKLSWEGDDLTGITWLAITTPDGHTHRGGYGGFSLASGSAVSVYSGGADHVPNGAILRVSSQATALEALTSDGVTQVLDLVEHPAHQGASVAALIYPPGTKITSVLLSDEAGQRTVPITQRQA